MQKSKTIKKHEGEEAYCYYYTYRSVKAIQSKIYQIKPEVEQEYQVIEDRLMQHSVDVKDHLQSLKKQFDLVKDKSKLSSSKTTETLSSPNKKILFVSHKVKKAEDREPLIKKFKPASKQIFKVQKSQHKFLRTPTIRESKSNIFICQKVVQEEYQKYEESKENIKSCKNAIFQIAKQPKIDLEFSIINKHITNINDSTSSH